MKVLFVGDIFGEVGRNCLKEKLPLIIQEYGIDFVIVNGENSSHGSGMIFKHYLEIVESGANAITSGNHFFSRDYTESYFSKSPLFVRPLNIEEHISGAGSKVFEINGIKIRITNLLGTAMIRQYGQTNIYDAMDKLLKTCKEKIHIVDLHAEPSGEKMAFAYNFDGKVSAVIGTHTHVQTSDENILPHGTAYITDVGMTGPYRSCIGSKIKPTIERLRYTGHTKQDVSYNPAIFNAVIIDINEETGLANSIKRISIKPIESGEINYEN